MKRRVILIGTIVLLIIFSNLALSVYSQETIVVDYADNFETNTLSESSTLLAYLAGIADRIAVEYSDLMSHIGLVPVPAELENKLNAVSDRVRLEYGDDVRHLGLAAVPAALQNHLATIADRVVFQYPDDNRQVSLDYPVNLIGDTTTPVIVTPPEARASGSTAIITWSTDEFTTYVLHYGQSPGNYTNQVSSSQFSKDHYATLPELTGDTYYYQIVSTDLSGNDSTSSEYVFEVENLLFLPLVTR